MQDSGKERRSEHDLLETRHKCLRSLPNVFDFKPSWGLHPGVGHHDPERAERRPYDDHRRRKEPHTVSEASAAKKHETKKSAFEHECEDSFSGKKASEDIANES